MKVPKRSLLVTVMLVIFLGQYSMVHAVNIGDASDDVWTAGSTSLDYGDIAMVEFVGSKMIITFAQELDTGGEQLHILVLLSEAHTGWDAAFVFSKIGDEEIVHWTIQDMADPADWTRERYQHHYIENGDLYLVFQEYDGLFHANVALMSIASDGSSHSYDYAPDTYAFSSEFGVFADLMYPIPVVPAGGSSGTPTQTTTETSTQETTDTSEDPTDSSEETTRTTDDPTDTSDESSKPPTGETDDATSPTINLPLDAFFMVVSIIVVSVTIRKIDRTRK